MAINVDQLKIVHYPHPVLRQVARPVAAVTPEVQAVARKMLELMHEARGVGLAAPQVGLSWRMFVVNATGDAADDMVFINPQLVDPGRKLEDSEEGCLSLPEIRGDIRRPKLITIKALDIDGKPVEITSDEFPARIWQHENDHLDGVMIIDRMPPVDRMASQRTLRELELNFKR
jgi:peptide deformylase